ncbi:HAD-IA family hydrolase [Mucilaginibacter sp. JRF]|uniref:HAD-IA family hydrolase n=1 Tax=Mucilaginibacter sp. JRF TaxID=2780088 RepID=UPI001D16D8D8|nr:HAD-IA family hydrolase [Mucilaginibacter sp. JRF]
MSTLIKMAVFDMAGTSVNENNIVYKTLHKAINEAGYNFTLNEVLAEGAGKEKLQAIKSILSTYGGVNDNGLAGNIYENFSAQLTEAYQTSTLLPQPNAGELFAALKERRIVRVLNTGYSRQVAQSIIDKLNWKQGAEYDELVTATDVSGGRPEPDMILFAADKYAVSPAEIVKVGDSIIDIEEGKNAGCALSIGITTGAHTPEQLRSANPDHVIDNLIDLLPIIDRYN